MKEERLDVVDENDNFMRKATRKEIESKNLWHRDSRIIVFNSFGKLFVQKRSRNKERHPSYWDIGVAETVESDESYEEAAKRGLKEEFGIEHADLVCLFKIKNKSEDSNEFCSVYETSCNEDINFQKEEIEKIDCLTSSEIKDLIQKEKFHPIGKIVFEKYMEYIKLKKC